MIENETNTVSDAEAATKERKVGADKVSTETGLLGTGEVTNSPANQPEHDEVSKSGGAGHIRSAAPDLPRCTQGRIPTEMAAPARFPYDRGKADLAAECQNRKWLDLVANCLPIDADIFLIYQTGVPFTAGREQEQAPGTDGGLEAGKHRIPAPAPTPNRTSFPYDPGGLHGEKVGA